MEYQKKDNEILRNIYLNLTQRNHIYLGYNIKFKYKG